MESMSIVFSKNVEAKLGIRILENIGKGAFASVYLAETNITKRKVAVKVVSCKSKCGNSKEISSQINNALSEAYTLRNMKHPNIIQFIKQVVNDDKVYIIEEYAEIDLYRLINTGEFSKANTEKAMEIFIQLCDAVAYCHSISIYHRDLKPENILIKNGIVKLADFGLATNQKISDEYFVGSPNYMSPDVCWKGSGDLYQPFGYCSASNDVWSLGIILINMLTSQNPWMEACIIRCEKYKSFRENQFFLRDTFQFSSELSNVLKQVFHIKYKARPTASALGKMIQSIQKIWDCPSETQSMSTVCQIEEHDRKTALKEKAKLYVRNIRKLFLVSF